MIQRQLAENLHKNWPKGKAVVLLGARQTGKTTLLKGILPADTTLFLTGDDPAVIRQMENTELAALKQRIAGYSHVFIDEAQRIPNIGVTAKLITDHFPKVKLVLSGSSALEIADGTSESLTGRKREFQLYPVSWKEFAGWKGKVQALQDLENRLIFGMYPEVITNTGKEQEILTELAGSYLYKDLLSYRGIRKPRLLEKILHALAWQIGSEVSLTELGQTVGADKATVESYIELLEKAFIIFRLHGLNRNLRNEIKKFSKIYFWDTGIRNALLGLYQPLSMRNDTGQLFENFVIAERIKFLRYNASHAKSWFWRTQAQQEVDYVEELNNKFTGVEIKWNPKSKVKFPASFLENYKAGTEVIHRDNFDLWVM